MDAYLQYLEDEMFPPPARRRIQIDLVTFDNDPLAWSRPQQRLRRGEFSMAAVQSYRNIEDHSQVDVGEDALFVGVYDGHKGDDAARYIRTHALEALLRRIQANNYNMTENIMRQVVGEIETGFMAYAEGDYQQHHLSHIGFVSSGCLICIIWRGTLYLANVGNSRAILGSQTDFLLFKSLNVKQMLRDHNCNNRKIRKELARLHPEEEQVCNEIGGRWYVKSLSETTRCIGYAYMKKMPFTQSESFQIPQGEEVTQPYTKSLLSSEPDVYSRVLKGNDRFIIFGSSGFWKLLTNKDAAKIVNTSPRDGIAKRLVTIALENLAAVSGRRYSDLTQLPQADYVSGRLADTHHGFRPSYHDDITVIVVYLDKTQSGVGERPEVKSYRGNDDTVRRSVFVDFYENNMRQP